MPDRFGPRGTFAIVIPLQNANMQPEYEAMRPDGVNNQIYRFDITGHDQAAEAIVAAVPGTLMCWPDMIVSAMSLEMHNWSRARQDAFRAAFAAAAGGVPTVLATDASEAALRTLGARRIGLLSPMSDANSRTAAAYYEAAGFEVRHISSLQVARSQDIIKVPVGDIEAGFARTDHHDIDTLLHVGGALGIVGMIDRLEARFGKPIVSVNAATYWYALRRHGISDPLPGFGQLLMTAVVDE